MAETAIISAEIRDIAGKGAARAERRADRVPAVIYGDKQPPVLIAIENKIALREVNRRGFFTHLYDIDIKGKKHRVLARDVQFDPVTDRPLHIDFLRVAAHTRVRVAVPLQFINQDKSPGLKRGGMLNIVAHELELLVSPEAIPESVEVDVTGQEMNSSIHLAAVKMPKGAKAVITDGETTIATIVPPAAAKAEETAAAPVAAAAAAAPAAAGKAAPAAAAGKAAAPAAGKAAAPAAKAPAKK
ncbi:MAG: 50S ribosomal protein L25/general stress protein Ctc [Alphaproteobacteria bacterium]|nr:50S ribosomal protein L25/general stress protein Ctc [Alphaproteobacteria bacterium]